MSAVIFSLDLDWTGLGRGGLTTDKRQNQASKRIEEGPDDFGGSDRVRWSFDPPPYPR